MVACEDVSATAPYLERKDLTRARDLTHVVIRAQDRDLFGEVEVTREDDSLVDLTLDNERLITLSPQLHLFEVKL
jgi:hypothetical protein